MRVSPSQVNLSLILWWVDTRWACGGVLTDQAGTIVDGAPVFRRLRGRRIQELPYRVVFLGA